MTIGLREQKKQELRDRLSLTTVVLSKERGLANVRVEDIVERVGVSRRTFSNYFASKEDAIADRHVQRTRVAADALRRRPAEEPLWDAVIAVIVGPYAEHTDAVGAQSKEEQDSLVAMLSEPDMEAAVTRGSNAAIEEFAQAVADRLGTDVNSDIYPRLVANAVLTTQLLTVNFWLRADPPVSLLPLMRDAFRHLGTGLERRAADSGTVDAQEGRS
jgi:AcrR family transcriptional regulator